MKSTSRNNFIDLLKLIASFFVITLHVGAYPEFVGEAIRLSAKWAVPFFFIVTGVMLSTSQDKNLLNKYLSKILIIYLVTSILFLPYIFLQSNSDLITMFDRITSKELLLFGFYFHLWYLISLALGVVLFILLKDTINDKYIFLLASFIFIVVIVFDIFSSIGFMEYKSKLPRHFVSFSFISFGYLITKYKLYLKLQVKYLIMICFMSTCLAFLGPYVFQELFKAKISSREFPIFVGLQASSFVLLALRINIKKTILSDMGRNYSLGIYLLHPLYIPIIKNGLNYFNCYHVMSLLIITFISSVITLYILKTRFDWFYQLLNGKIK